MAGTLDSRLKHIFQFSPRSMEFFVIQKYQFREQHRFFMSFLSLAFTADFQHGDGSHFRKTAGAGSRCHGNKRIIPTAGRHRIEFIFPPLESLFHISFHISPGHFFRLFLAQTQIFIFFNVFLIRFFRIRSQDLFHTGNGKSAILLAGCAEYNVSDHVECHVKGLRLIIPEISHFKTACQDFLYIEQTAVHRIPSGRHIMDINISVIHCLKFLYCHKKLLIQGLIQFIKDQASLCGNQSAVCIGIFLISNVHDGLALFINIIQHLHKILLIIAVIPVTLRHRRIYPLQSSFHQIMHLGNGNLRYVQGFCFLFHKLADKVQLRLGKGNHCPFCRFIDCHYYFLYIKFLFCTVFFNHFDFTALQRRFLLILLPAVHPRPVCTVILLLLPV